MTQPSPTPVPDHGTGWGLLFLFSWLYGIVALLGTCTVLAIVVEKADRRIPTVLHYLVVTLLLGALGISGFTVLVAATARQYDVVALLLLIVFTPLTFSFLQYHDPTQWRVAIVSRAAMDWSIPFLVGFSGLAFVGTLVDGIPPEATGMMAVILVIAGTVLFERLSVVPPTATGRE